MIEAIITFLVIGAIVVFIVRFLGWMVTPFIGNILTGGILYWFIDAFLFSLPWSFLDAMLVALFGVPGTIVIALFRGIF